MSIIAAHRASKAFQGRPVFEDVTFAIDRGDRIGLIGHNGSGKSTLLRLIEGTMAPDTGSVQRAHSILVSRLEQRPLAYDHGRYAILENPRFTNMEREMRDLERAMDRAKGERLDALIAEHSRLLTRWEVEGADDYAARLARHLAGLGLSEAQMHQPYDTLSGGERMRVALGRLLLEPSDVLLLDEPTNHLDLDGMEWLQDYLLSRHTTLVVVSHDRWFLDALCGRIFELEHHRLATYRGNFTAARRQKHERNVFLGKTLNRLSAEIERQEGVVQTMLSHRNMTSYHAREKVVRKLREEYEALAEHKHPDRRMTFSFVEPDPRRDRRGRLIEARDLAIAFDHPLFADVSFNIEAGEKWALVGPNGCGKTTLLKILMGRLAADRGDLRIVGDPDMAYMGQNVTFEDDRLTVYAYLSERFPETETTIRSRLAQFGFREEAMIKRLGVLSGGERHRLYLCALLEQRPDVLILDEPTNHLDIESRELLEQAIDDYPGAVIATSHDRYFVDAMADQVLGFVGDRVERFDGYRDWLRARRAFLERPTAPNAADAADAADDMPLTPADLRRIRARRREALGELEAEIGALEAEKAAFEAADPADLLPEDYARYAERLDALDRLYDAFFEMAERHEADPV